MKQTILLAFAVALQICVLTWEYVESQLPRWTGQQVSLAVLPVDPRSWFSGNYAELNYEIASLPRELYRGSEPVLRYGEVVYISLAQSGEIWTARELTLEPPRERLFLRGRLSRGWRGDESFSVRYGIEAYFAPKDRALAIERSLRAREGTATAQVSISPSGKAALIDLTLP